MFAFKTILALAAPLMVIANPLVARTDPPTTTCNSGSVQCCEQVQKTDSVPGLESMLTLLGLEDLLDALVGLQCDPITIIGAGSANCQNNAVCCTNNEFNGLINVGCSPIILNL